MEKYNKLNLLDLMYSFGDMFDYAKRLGINLDEFFPYFLQSNVSKGIEIGSPKYVSGMSGEELFFEVVLETGFSFCSVEEEGELLEKSPEYWAGYILIYLQYETRIRFKDIYRYIKIEEIVKSYYPLHEASEEKTVELYKSILKERMLKITNIQRLRKLSHLTQKELSDLANINLRTLQEYESRRKDINKASFKTLLQISNVLNCLVYDLYEVTI